MRPTVHIAGKEDSEAVHKLVVSNDVAEAIFEGVGWSDISPYWLVAKLKGEVVGCMQVIMAKPIGRIEFLATKPGIHPQARARVVKELMNQGFSVLERAGASMVAGTIATEMKPWKRQIKRMGAEMMGQGNMFVKRLN